MLAVSPLAGVPLLLVSANDTGTGSALSATAVAANDDWLPAASRIPAALAARATLNPLAWVSTPVPSFRVSDACEPATDTDESVTPLGWPVSVHGAVPAV